MARPNHKARAPLDAAPGIPRKPTNPLGRPYWLYTLSTDPKHQLPATCAALTMGTHALVRVLTNSEAFRALQESCATTEPGHAPLDAHLTEGLFAALYMLSEQAAQACAEWTDRVGDV